MVEVKLSSAAAHNPEVSVYGLCHSQHHVGLSDNSLSRQIPGASRMRYR